MWAGSAAFVEGRIRFRHDALKRIDYIGVHVPHAQHGRCAGDQ